MYEELVKQLRDHAICADSGNGIGNSMYLNILKAADAIEELSKRVEFEHQSGFADGQIAASRKKSRWIPVTERLPDKSGNYLTAFEDGTAMAVNEFMHPRDWLTEEGRKAHPNGKWYFGDVTHWQPLPEPPKENGKSET